MSPSASAQSMTTSVRTEWKHIYLCAIFPPGIQILGSCFRMTGHENKYQFFAASLSSCSNRGLELVMSNGFHPRWYIIREVSKCVCSSYLNPGWRRENVGVTSKACSHQEIGEEKIIHYNHQMQWIMVYMTRYWINTLHKTYSCDYNGLSFPHQFPDAGSSSSERFPVCQNSAISKQ